MLLSVCKHTKPSTTPWSVLCERGRSENFDSGTEQSSWKHVTKQKLVKLQRQHVPRALQFKMAL